MQEQWPNGSEDTGRAVEVRSSAVQTDRNRYRFNTGKGGLGGSCRVVWLNGAMPTKLVASIPSQSDGSRFSPRANDAYCQAQTMIFSSTTVALASCSSDHFPKRPMYISDVRET